MTHKQALNSARRRIRKEQLARRHGQRCAYCRRPFGDLREATLDHIVPHSLWRTWTVTALALACLDCNNAKADPSRPTADPALRPLLARLAHANHSAYEAVWTPGPIDRRSPPDLCDDPRHTPRHTPRHALASRLITRSDCLRTPRPVQVCARPIEEAA
ncbi:HNH endonuclease [Streptomyces sp. URMC 123]|uniref:HNH endonuclease n=1 Tax=Streptomyces sp. URMC 123 TaxID=3423403 RepID=UPI003F1D0D29